MEDNCHDMDCKSVFFLQNTILQERVTSDMEDQVIEPINCMHRELQYVATVVHFYLSFFLFLLENRKCKCFETSFQLHQFNVLNLENTRYVRRELQHITHHAPFSCFTAKA